MQDAAARRLQKSTALISSHETQIWSQHSESHTHLHNKIHHHLVPGVEECTTREVAASVQPLIRHARFSIRLGISQEYAEASEHSINVVACPGPTQASANAIRIQPSLNNHIQLYNVTGDVTEPAPTIIVKITSSSGTRQVEVLPDSGADISAAGQETLKDLGQHIDNLLPSHIIARAVNGSCMTPIGKLPVTIQLEERRYTDDLHIYPGVSGALISWKAAKGLGILPDHYPHPGRLFKDTPQPDIKTASSELSSTFPTAGEIMHEFSSVFNGQVTTMHGETFTISLKEGAEPFCVKTPRSVPFVYREKLKKELDLLQQQGIIEPVTEATEWCTPIVVMPKKDTDRIRLCVDLSRLNRYVRRERYQSPTPSEAVADIAAEDAKFFTVLDAQKGYHQCLLDEASQLLTTFITPFG